ncbi:hypothetical protein [Ochrobactrum sp. RH2CCR150]|nr:hypothetical protein [Ochrobactrum sp. RH2CCR150]
MAYDIFSMGSMIMLGNRAKAASRYKTNGLWKAFLRAASAALFIS